MQFAHDFVPNFTEFTIKPQELTLKNINQYFIRLARVDEKYPTLIEIYGQKSMGQCIIFCEVRLCCLVSPVLIGQLFPVSVTANGIPPQDNAGERFTLIVLVVRRTGLHTEGGGNTEFQKR